MSTIKVNVISYRYRADDPEYRALRETLKARGLKEMQVWHTARGREVESGEYNVETKHLFDNQSNTVEGFRVFDWYDGLANHERSYRIGHYIVDDAGFAALQEARRNTNRCGYCGKQEAAARGSVFHLECLGSEYLDSKTLKLIRMVCVADHNPAFPELSKAEAAYLLPQYREAQLHGNNERSRKRIAAKRASIAADYDSAIKHATAERDGFTWLMDHGINTDNVIYYRHTGRFGFGWRKPVDASLYAELCEALCEFPFDYDIKHD